MLKPSKNIWSLSAPSESAKAGKYSAGVYWKHFLGVLVAKADRMVATIMISRQIVCLFDRRTLSEKRSPLRDGVRRKQSASRLSRFQSFSSAFITFNVVLSRKVEMDSALSLSPHLSSSLCYKLSSERRDDDSRRLIVVGVYERAAHAVAALRRLRLLIHSRPVAAVDGEDMESLNGNQLGPLYDPEDPENRIIGWGYRLRKPDTDDVFTIWIKQVFMMREVADDGLLGPPENVNWTNFVEESRIHISDDTLHSTLR